EAEKRGHRGSDVRALRIVVETDAAHLGDELSPVRKRSKLAENLGNHLGGHRERGDRRDRCRDVERVVGTAKPDAIARILNGHAPAASVSTEEAFAPTPNATTRAPPRRASAKRRGSSCTTARSAAVCRTNMRPLASR